MTDGPHLVGIDLPSGGQFSLETGGALEFSSAPCESVGAAIQTALVALRKAAGIADRLGVALLSGSMLPFTPVDKVPWIPKPRVGVMRRYFRTLGEAGSCADGVMGLVLSTQTSFDYVSPRDLIAKLRLHVAASPVAAALFVNSPIQDGAVCGPCSPGCNSGGTWIRAGVGFSGSSCSTRTATSTPSSTGLWPFR